MKRALLLIVIITGAFLINITFSSCKKKETPLPDYPQLLGTWPGTTSQGTTISLGVTNINGNLYINQYDVMVYTVSGYQEFRAGSSAGLAIVNGTQFKIHLGTGNAGESYIDGTFDVQDTLLYGNFAVYPSGDIIDLITGTYSCNKSH
ncbi:MAG: hypothetical protein ABSD71_00885 [Bacteroidales bacterium]|jgi:hypothetical protein